MVADLPLESVVEVSGTIQLRPAGQANKARRCSASVICSIAQ